MFIKADTVDQRETRISESSSKRVYKPWAMENKRSFKSNDKYKLSIICESKCFKGKTFAQISPLLIEKYKKEAS
jgi:hypothetical protein